MGEEERRVLQQQQEAEHRRMEQQRQQQMQQQPAQLQGASSDSEICLVLGGSCVLPDFPESKRRHPISKDGLTIGRAQHLEGLRGGVVKYVSREHFRVERSGMCWQVVGLSSNPIWRSRNGKRDETCKGEASLDLANGDSILLFTGADDCTPDGPGSVGLL